MKKLSVFMSGLLCRLGLRKTWKNDKWKNDKWYHPLYRRFRLVRALVWKWELRKFPAWFAKIKEGKL